MSKTRNNPDIINIQFKAVKGNGDFEDIQYIEEIHPNKKLSNIVREGLKGYALLYKVSGVKKLDDLITIVSKKKGDLDNSTEE